MTKKVLLLGASGSIGKQTIDLLREHQNKFVLTAFSVGNNYKAIPDLLCEFKHVKFVYLISKQHATVLSKVFPKVKFLSGAKGLTKLTKVAHYDICVDALVGFVGLEPAIISLEKNKTLCLANKEALVTGGALINKILESGKGKIFPIDSEHVALAKCLSTCKAKDVKRLIITASGGALRNVPINKLNSKKAKDALKHPIWKMGEKITIDCATMMNKGFEIIEAHYLFKYPLNHIDVLMHDESLVHSAVELKDGTILIDYGKPDMHNPIWWALNEGKVDFKIKKIKSFSSLKNCHFHKYNPKRYPCTELAKQALNEGEDKLVILNAVNEVMVHKYLNDEVKFLDISMKISEALDSSYGRYNLTLAEIKQIDKQARRSVE